MNIGSVTQLVMEGAPSSDIRDFIEFTTRVGLPTTYSGAASFDELRDAMSIDKKARGSHLRFVVLDDLAVPRVLVAPDEEALVAAYDAITGGAS